MLISCAWLNELLVDAPISLKADGELTPDRVAATLTSLGLEVEGVRYFDLPGVIVGEIRQLAPHPKADKLTVVQLFDGSNTVQVVCGASNLPPVGGKVAFAPVGTTLPGGLTLGARELRGVASQGMICSEQELDIGSDSAGIMVLPNDWAAGTLLADAIPGIVDAVIEIAVTPNRPDALGHLGVAIDLAVALATRVREPEQWTPPADLPRDPELVTITAPDRCARYFGYGLEQVRVGRSPAWLRVRLHRVGLRAINDVVDITNYVLMETGQPIHAFDRAKLDQGRVVVRMAAPEEPITTLDDTELKLTSDDLVIADASRAQALAGVMGGADSAVSDSTDRLLLEVAYFEPKGIRRTGRRHDISSDSRYRFERGVDHGDKLELTAKRALHLLHTLCGAACVVGAEALGQRPPTPTITLRPDRIGALLGMQIQADEAERILTGLGITVDRTSSNEGSNEGEWRCTPPSMRPDLQREVDLIEEVMRHHGLDDLPAVHSPASEQRQPIAEDPHRRRAEQLRDALRGTGLREHLSLAFSSEAALAPVLAPGERERLVRLRNPLRVQASVLRSHMLPGLLDAVALNHAHHDRPLALFEIGRIYRWPIREPEVAGPTAAIDRKLPDEPTRAAIVLARRADEDRASSLVTRDAVERVLVALDSLGIAAELRPAEPVAWLHPGVQIGVWRGAVQLGIVGELHPDIVAARELDDLELAYAELWLEALPTSFEPAYREIARFPSTARDLSLDLADSITAAETVASLRDAFASIEASRAGQGDPIDPVVLGSSADPRAAIETIEEYRGKGVAPGRRALLLRLHYRAHERSVTDSEVQPLHDAVVEAACAKLRATDPDLRVR